MSAYPFGQQPRLGDYLEFLRTQGCTYVVRGSVGKDGRTYRELVITNGSDQHYVMVMPDPNERVSIYIVENIKRRLGVTEPYVPPHPPLASDDPDPPNED